MKTLLVPIDFSSYSLQACRTAAQIARNTGAQIILLTNIVTDLNWKGLRPTQQMAHPETLAKTKDAEVKLDKLMESSLFDRLTVSKIISHGYTYEEILRHAKHQKADMIVMGVHGNAPSEHYFIGSNIQKVLRETEIPVLAIKGSTIVNRWKKLVFVGEFDFDMSKAFKPIKQLAEEFKSRIHLLYVNLPAKFKDSKLIHQQMQKFAAKYPSLKFDEGVSSDYELEDGILNYAESVDADLIAVITSDRRNTPGYRIGITETLVFRSRTPVLVVTPPREALK